MVYGGRAVWEEIEPGTGTVEIGGDCFPLFTRDRVFAVVLPKIIPSNCLSLLSFYCSFL